MDQLAASRAATAGMRSSEEPLVPAPLLSSQPVVEPLRSQMATSGFDGTEFGAGPRGASFEATLASDVLSEDVPRQSRNGAPTLAAAFGARQAFKFRRHGATC